MERAIADLREAIKRRDHRLIIETLASDPEVCRYFLTDDRLPLDDFHYFLQCVEDEHDPYSGAMASVLNARLDSRHFPGKKYHVLIDMLRWGEEISVDTNYDGLITRFLSVLHHPLTDPSVTDEKGNGLYDFSSFPENKAEIKV